MAVALNAIILTTLSKQNKETYKKSKNANNRGTSVNKVLKSYLL